MSSTAVDVPPMNARRSSSSVRAPWRAAVIAADDPAEPEPDDDDVVAVAHAGAPAPAIAYRRAGLVDEDPLDGVVAEPAPEAGHERASSGSACPGPPSYARR